MVCSLLRYFTFTSLCFQMKMTPSLSNTYPQLVFIEIISWCQKYSATQWSGMYEQVRLQKKKNKKKEEMLWLCLFLFLIFGCLQLFYEILGWLINCIGPLSIFVRSDKFFHISYFVLLTPMVVNYISCGVSQHFHTIVSKTYSSIVVLFITLVVTKSRLGVLKRQVQSLIAHQVSRLLFAEYKGLT